MERRKVLAGALRIECAGMGCREIGWESWPALCNSDRVGLATALLRWGRSLRLKEGYLDVRTGCTEIVHAESCHGDRTARWWAGIIPIRTIRPILQAGQRLPSCCSTFLPWSDRTAPNKARYSTPHFGSCRVQPVLQFELRSQRFKSREGLL
jgi:hypothetical protein